jgi:hypothetical protein
LSLLITKIKLLEQAATRLNNVIEIYHNSIQNIANIINIPTSQTVVDKDTLPELKKWLSLISQTIEQKCNAQIK